MNGAWARLPLVPYPFSGHRIEIVLFIGTTNLKFSKSNAFREAFDLAPFAFDSVESML